MLIPCPVHGPGGAKPPPGLRAGCRGAPCALSCVPVRVPDGTHSTHEAHGSALHSHVYYSM